MKQLRITSIQIEANAGASIDDCIDEAKELARMIDRVVVFAFNGAEVVVRPDSNAQDVSENWNLRRQLISKNHA